MVPVRGGSAIRAVRFMEKVPMNEQVQVRDNSVECCPVCGMQAGDWVGNYAMQYHKMYFHFCSGQCQETFQAHPRLYSSKRAKSAGEVIKCRKLRLATKPNPETSEAISEYLQGLMGLKESHVTGCRLTVRYDLLQLTLAQLENALKRVDITFDHRWWQRLRRSWIRDTETNELENLAASPGGCCNRPPPGV